MTLAPVSRSTAAGESRHYRELFRHTLSRQILLYFMPLLLLAVFFHIQYRHLLRESARAHLAVIAEQQAATFDLFLRERLTNLANIIEDPLFTPHARDEAYMSVRLATLQQTSDAFADLGVVSVDGQLVTYVGPVTFPEGVNYHDEPWFAELLAGEDRSLITEIYLGFRGRPHFTIAVKRARNGSVQVLRSTLSPERLAEYLATLEGASEVHAAVVSATGILQVAAPRGGSALRDSRFSPPRQPARGIMPQDRAAGVPEYAYAWLRETPWALVVTEAPNPAGGGIAAFPGNIFGITVAFFALMGVVILGRARQLVGKQLAVEHHEAELSGQLVQAAKLASVGELAAGIAHEINNPLAVIAEEVGVLKDSLDPALVQEGDPPIDLPEHLHAIHEAVFRCRDITRKLLGFVRQTEVRVERQDLHAILDDVVDGMLGNELTISSITVVREYDPTVLEILTDRNQLVQVFVNLVKNAVDAMPRGGTLTIMTRHLEDRVAIAMRDSGCGIPAAQLDQIFMPFFTTKEPGSGTGLGLSVSYTIIKTFGGTVRVDSAPGHGSTFTIELPYHPS
ncbi:MAG: ATP-binding protein [Gemmatimonadota bacterium]|nr:ATP-binding protein [Gemmatimonadota bacterium]MDH4349974.1 ATP-binding protein [Gemmatimonadota bacterium]MDH5195674.1 ATP-binding protein [Gemmatimonadota bacterium]